MNRSAAILLLVSPVLGLAACSGQGGTGGAAPGVDATADARGDASTRTSTDASTRASRDAQGDAPKESSSDAPTAARSDGSACHDPNGPFDAGEAGMLELPHPTGPYAIGTQLRQLVDPTRIDPLAPDAGTPSTVLVQLYYPADPCAAGSPMPQA